MRPQRSCRRQFDAIKDLEVQQVCKVMYAFLIIKPTRCTNFSKFIFGISFYFIRINKKKNKFEKLVHLFGFIIRIYQDVRSPERQMIYAVLPKVLIPILWGGQNKFFLICTIFEFGLYEFISYSFFSQTSEVQCRQFLTKGSWRWLPRWTILLWSLVWPTLTPDLTTGKGATHANIAYTFRRYRI